MFRWSPRADALARIVSPEVAADRLGIPLADVLARREVLSLPPADEQFPRRTRKRVGRKPPYAEYEAEVLRLFPPATAAYILGCSLTKVSIKRQRLGIAHRKKQAKPCERLRSRRKARTDLGSRVRPRSI
jgi:hypothetical protein